MREFIQMIAGVFGFMFVWVGGMLAISAVVGVLICLISPHC